MDDSIKPNFSASHKGHFQKAQNFVVFFRSQTHSYAYHLVSVRRHNQHVRSPIQGFFRCEGISFIPRVQQRSTFLQLSPQEHTNCITSHRPASIAASSDQPTSAEDSRNAATRHRRESAAAMLCGGGTGNGMVSSQVASATYCAAVRKSHARSWRNRQVRPAAGYNRQFP